LCIATQYIRLADQHDRRSKAKTINESFREYVSNLCSADAAGAHIRGHSSSRYGSRGNTAVRSFPEHAMTLSTSDLPPGRIKNCTFSFQRASPRLSVICVTSQHEASNRYAYSTGREGRANLFTFEAAPAQFEAAQPTTSTDSSVIFAPFCALEAPLAGSHDPRAAPWRAAPAGVAWRSTRPRPGLSVNPSTPCARNRCAHLYTKRRLSPTVAAMAVIGTPSAISKMILPRLARPAEMVVARCHARNVRRSAGVRWMVREVLRPRAIQRPSVIHG
jgi:hypothetical protein